MLSVLESINRGLSEAMSADSRVIILGEDILDPYGGAFKVTKGLSTQFPERVITTPISEAGITGLAIGMAMRGLRPVVEIMFGDFLTLTADQIINHASKFRWMYNEKVRVPLLIRTPMGARRGYGPTHSQTLESLFIGIPGLRVLAPSALGDAGNLLRDTILSTEDPVLFVENKLLYLLKKHEGWDEFDISEPNRPGERIAVIRGAPQATLTITAYGYMSEIARQAVIRLAYEYEVFAELVIIEELAPVNITTILNSLSRTHKLLTIEEGTLTLGWGTEIITRAVETLGQRLNSAHRLAANETPIPASKPLEDAALPGVEKIIETACKIMDK